MSDHKDKMEVNKVKTRVRYKAKAHILKSIKKKDKGK